MLLLAFESNHLHRYFPLFLDVSCFAPKCLACSRVIALSSKSPSEHQTRYSGVLIPLRNSSRTKVSCFATTTSLISSKGGGWAVAPAKIGNCSGKASSFLAGTTLLQSKPYDWSIPAPLSRFVYSTVLPHRLTTVVSAAVAIGCRPLPFKLHCQSRSTLPCRNRSTERLARWLTL